MWRDGGRAQVGLLLALALAWGAVHGEIARAEGELDPARSETWQLPNADLYGVALIGRTAWAVGYWGTILRSTDGGTSWTSIATPVEATLFAVSFGDERNGWAVGERGLILHSTDGGESWTRSTVTVQDASGEHPLDSHLLGVSAVSATEAWAVGDLGIVLHTVDGATWSRVEIPAETWTDGNLPERVLNGVHFSDASHGWIAGEFATTLRTSDGGATWTATRTLEDTVDDLYLFDVNAEPGGRAVATGLAGAVLLTEDGGNVWKPRTAPTGAGLFAATMQGDRVIAVGDRGELFLSTDRGLAWKRPERPRQFNWLRAVSLGGDGVAITVGERGLILTSSDGGASWVQTRGQPPTTRAGVSVPEPGRSTEPGRTEPAPMAPPPPAGASPTKP